MVDKKVLRKYALQNAIFYKGKANPGAVLGKVLSEDSSLKPKAKQIAKQIALIVTEVNALPLDKQKKELENLAPELLEKKKKEERDIFAFLGIKEGEKIVTAFPPGVEKYPHIGHAKACLLNYLLAKRYKGKFKLRFEDTNPKLVKQEFYDIMQDNLAWLGVTWSDLDYASDHMDMYYTHAEELIQKGKAYMCFCDSETTKLSRQKGIACDCRSRSTEDNMTFWKEFPGYPEGKAVLRLNIDLTHKNSTMRDPAIFRVIKTEHARHKKKYTVWPNYDFQTAIMDGYKKVTHRLRSKEFEMRNELQRWIQKELGYKETHIYELARFNMEGVPSSGRVIREMLADKDLVGWDDPKLTTIVALRRRGFLPEAITNFVVSTGISKSESTLTWDDLIVHNRRLLDDIAERYFFIDDPVEVRITGAPKQKVTLKKNPNNTKKGVRTFDVHDTFYITRHDFRALKDGNLYRFMDCLNFVKKGKELVYDSSDHTIFKDKGTMIMHFLPKSDSLVPVEVFMPDHSIVKGYAEKDVASCEVGQVIQFERFGFVRLDSRKKRTLSFWYTHK